VAVHKSRLLRWTGPSGLHARLPLFVFFAVVPSSGLILYTAGEARPPAAIELQAEWHRSARLASADHGRPVVSGSAGAAARG
jgi:hypothetical protein